MSADRTAPRQCEHAIDFWFDLASPYSFLAAARISATAVNTRSVIRWRPILFGAILKRKGLDTSPFNLDQAKGTYMWRDVARRGAGLGLTIRRPEGFPHNSLAAARVTLVGLTEGWGQQFVLNIYEAGFCHGDDVGQRDVIARCVRAAGGNPDDALARSESPQVKITLREETDVAIARGVFGVPSFTIGQELFWGDDRLSDALAWADDIPIF